MRSIRDLKISARRAMSGHTGSLILAMVIYTVVSFTGSQLTDSFFPGTDFTSMALSQAFLFLLTLVFGILYAGVRYMYLNVARGREYSMGNLIYFFKNDPDKVIIATLVLSLISLLLTLPVNFYLYHLETGTTLEAQLEWMMISSVLMLLVSAANEVLTLPFEMTYYLLADHPEMNGFTALKKSVSIMRGKMGKLLLLKISFLPIMFLSIFTLYLALIWIIPYMEMTTAEFYRDLIGEPLGTEEIY